MATKVVREFVDEDWQFEVPTSFIDCVFLLLIFFLLTANFKSFERALQADLPGPGPRHGDWDPPHEVRVKLFWEDAIGRVVRGPNAETPARVLHIAVHANNMPCADLNDLAAKLAAIKARQPRIPVLIDARQRVPFKWVLGAIDACARARITDVRFQAPPVAGAGGGDWWYY